VLTRPSGAREPRLLSPDIDFDESRPLSGLINQ
jgi:hypothetical protein